jgi:hypothetical protein
VTDVTSILASAYKSNTLSVSQTSSKYAAVDPGLYEGSWSGKYANNKSFTISVSTVSGFRAKVLYQRDGTSLINDGAFQIGDTKFTLTAKGKATIKNVVTDPASGQAYLDTAYATQSERQPGMTERGPDRRRRRARRCSRPRPYAVRSVGRTRGVSSFCMSSVWK